MPKKARRTYADVRRQIEALQKEAQELHAQEIAGVVERINEAIAHYDIQPGDLRFPGRKSAAGRRAVAKGKNGAKGGKAAKGSAPKAPAVIKYRDGEDRFWSGRGPRPRWLREALEQGRQLADFAV